MKKLLLIIINGFPEHALRFAIEMCKNEPYKLNALMVAVPDGSVATGADLLKQHALKINAFADLCNKNKIKVYIQTVSENVLDTIVDETAFADIVLCDDAMDTTAFSMHSFISSSHCPVVLVPAKAPVFKQIIFTYDGSITSINAMKQFAYLLGWTSKLKAHLVSVLPHNILEMEYDALVREWFGLHYPNGEVFVLRGDLKTHMPDFINSHQNSLVVMGAFGRSALSRFFKESLAPNILRTTTAPLFISHN